MCINLNTQTVLMETKVLLTYLSTSSFAVSLVMLQNQFSQTTPDGCFSSGENLAYQEVPKPVQG